MKPVLSSLRALERVAVFIGCIFLFALMVLVTVDVFLRYFANQPLVWTHDVVTLYVMPTIFFLILSDSLQAGAQVRVDVLRDRFPPLLRGVADAIGYLGTAIGFALIGYAGWRQCVEAYVADEVVAGSIAWQVWPSFLLVAIGSAMLVIRLLAATIEGFINMDGRSDERSDVALEDLE